MTFRAFLVIWAVVIVTIWSIRVVQIGHDRLFQAEKATIEARMQAAVNASERSRLVTAEVLVIELQQQVAERDRTLADRDREVAWLRSVQGLRIALCQELQTREQPSELAAAICVEGE